MPVRENLHLSTIDLSCTDARKIHAYRNGTIQVLYSLVLHAHELGEYNIMHTGRLAAVH